MAQKNRPHLKQLRPEEKLAYTFLKRQKLKPPFEALPVLKGLAEVEEDDVPGDVDAILLPRPTGKPLVIFNRNKPDTRKVFTTAHEIGHLLIPWHTLSTYICKPSPGEFAGNPDEAEANRFASHFLMPQKWVSGLYKKFKSIDRTVAEIKKTGVSALAAAFGLIRALPPGYLFIRTDSMDAVEFSASSPGSSVKVPAKGEQVPDFSDILRGVENVDGMVWVRLRSKVSKPSTKRAAKEILSDLLNGITKNKAQKDQLIFSLNGVIGYASDRVPPGIDFFTHLYGKLINRTNLAPVTSHRLFKHFLAAKVKEITLKRQKKLILQAKPEINPEA